MSDVEESAAFYRAIGTTLFNDDQPGRPHVVDGHIGTTGPVLQLFPAGDSPVTRVQLGFRVTDIATAAAELTRRGIEYEIPGVRRLRTIDPDGSRVHLTDVVLLTEVAPPLAQPSLRFAAKTIFDAARRAIAGQSHLWPRPTGERDAPRCQADLLAFRRAEL